LDIGILSIVGKQREIDEDSVMAMSYERLSKDDSTYCCLCALADGMGGGSRGEVASKMALAEFWNVCKELLSYQADDSEKIRKVLLEGVKDANKAVVEYKEKNKLEEIGTTLTAAFMRGGEVYITNIGDSRTYLISEGRVEAKTKDHSYVQELVDAGRITSEEARLHQNRNIITKVIGAAKEVEPDFYEWRVYEGDSVLLCCDGLWEALGDDLICKFASAKLSAQEMTKEMVDKANTLDGSDNISAILVRPPVGQTREAVLGKATEARHRKQR
jgi:protein phosphatase